MFQPFTILHPREWPSGSGEVVLTFDNGPHPGDVSDRLLDVLEQRQVKASFFYIGQNVVRHPGAVRRAAEQGHAIGNHTYSHRWQSLCHAAVLREEILRTDRAIADALGQPGFRSRCFRPPYGLLTPAVRSVARQAGLQVPSLTFFIRDGWAGEREAPGIMTAIRQALRKHRGGAIILHEVKHLGSSLALGPSKDWLPGAVDELIRWAREENLRFTTYPAAG